MGKSEGFLTPKAIANRIKAKGLQKLRWYCQMCQKQCRDENGFKCHCSSESHQRQMLLFAQNPHKFMDAFSKEFEETFLQCLRSRHSTSRVSANHAYNEFISDKNHIHMNSTMWTSLTEFVKYLGRTSKCIVEETPKGWFISYIDRDPEVIARQEALKKKERADLDDEDRMQRLIEKQIEEAKQIAPELAEKEPEYTELNKNPDEKIVFNLGIKPKTTATASSTSKPPADKEVDDKTTAAAITESNKNEKPSKFSLTPPPGALAQQKKDAAPSPSSSAAAADEKKRKLSALDKIMLEEEQKKEKRNRKDYWLTPGIVVKVLNKTLADGKYYNKKGVVKSVIDKYVGKVKMIDTGHTLEIDQAQLETVIPQIGGTVRIVNGAYRGETATLVSVDFDNYCATLKITDGQHIGKVVSGIAYEDFSKLATE